MLVGRRSLRWTGDGRRKSSPLLAGIAAEMPLLQRVGQALRVGRARCVGVTFLSRFGLPGRLYGVDVHWPAVGGHRGRNAAPTLLAEPLTPNAERRTLNAKP